MEIRLTRALYEKYGFPHGESDVLSKDVEAQKFRLSFLKEELAELEEALEKGDRVAAFDALIDLSVVLHGTALWLGITPVQWTRGFLTVHSANMKKEVVKTPDEAKRGYSLDLKKPANWKAPESELAEVLDA